MKELIFKNLSCEALTLTQFSLPIKVCAVVFKSSLSSIVSLNKANLK